MKATTWSDAEYPWRLKEIQYPPPVLYIKGSIIPEDKRAVTVVGTRGPTAYGREAASVLTGGLSKNGITTVNGLARGVDGISHRAALDNGRSTIAVVTIGQWQKHHSRGHQRIVHRLSF